MPKRRAFISIWFEIKCNFSKGQQQSYKKEFFFCFNSTNFNDVNWCRWMTLSLGPFTLSDSSSQCSMKFSLRLFLKKKNIKFLINCENDDHCNYTTCITHYLGLLVRLKVAKIKKITSKRQWNEFLSLSFFFISGCCQ